MAAKKKAATKKKAPAKKKAASKTTAKANGKSDYQSYFDDDSSPESMGGSMVIPAANTVGSDQGPRIVIKRGGKDSKSFHESITGIVARSFIMRSFMIPPYDPRNPRPPACVSLDEATGTVHKDAADYMAQIPGFTGSCTDCPLAYAKDGCDRARMVYLRRTDVEADDEQPFIALKVTRSANAGAIDCYEPVMFADGRHEAKKEIKVKARLRSGSGNTYPSLSFEILGDSDLETYGPEMARFIDEVKPQVEQQQLLPPGGPASKQLTEGGPRKAEDVTFGS